MQAQSGQEQNTLGWYRARLGQITGSAVGNLMGAARGGKGFSATATSYMQQLAFERTMDKEIVENDELFAQYVGITEVKNKILEWGHKQEGCAADLFAAMFQSLYEPKAEPFTLKMEEPPSVRHPEIPHFASSPDRMFVNPVTGETCCVEIKSPQGKAFAKYACLIQLPTEEERLAELKKVEPNYYWQLFSHMMVTGTTMCYWVIYNPFSAKPLYSMEVNFNQEVVDQIAARVTEANAYIDELVEKLKG